MSEQDRPETIRDLADEDWLLANTTPFDADRRVANLELAAGMTKSIDVLLAECG